MALRRKLDNVSDEIGEYARRLLEKEESHVLADFEIVKEIAGASPPSAYRDIIIRAVSYTPGIWSMDIPEVEGGTTIYYLKGYMDAAKRKRDQLIKGTKSTET